MGYIKIQEPGGRFRPLPEINGVCPRCRDQIEWKRKYGKYKPLVEPAKWLVFYSFWVIFVNFDLWVLICIANQ